MRAEQFIVILFMKDDILKSKSDDQGLEICEY